MDLLQWSLVLAAFLLGGTVKGVVGLGLPTVALAVLGTALGLREAVLLLVAPAFLTNVWQASMGGRFLILLKRLWPMLLATVPGTTLGTYFLLRADQAVLDLLLGGILCAYALMSLAGTGFAVATAHERLLSPVIGFSTGIVAGTTGTLVLPVVPYLSALRLARDDLVQAMGMSFALSSLTLGVVLGAQRSAAVDQMLGSMLAVLPAIAGMFAGRCLRQRIAPARFRRWLFLSLLVLGVNLFRRGLVGLPY